MIATKLQLGACIALLMCTATNIEAQAPADKSPAAEKHPAAVSQRKLDATDELLKTAQEINTFISKAGRLAIEKSSSVEVKAFTNQLLRDHVLGYRGAGMDQTVAQLSKEAMNSEQMTMLQQLQSAQENFDRLYMDQMVITLRDALANSKKYGSFGTNDLLKKSIEASIAADEMNLKTADSLQAKLHGAESS